MAAKPFKEKELADAEKGPGFGKEFKPEIKEKHEKEHKEQKDHKDQKDKPEKEKHEKDKPEKEKPEKEKPEKEKPEKEKHEKEGKDFKDHKDKPEKDHHKEQLKEKELAKEAAKEKHEISESFTPGTEMISPEATAVSGAGIGKSIEHKFFKIEKHEIFEKFSKFEKPEKFEKHVKVEFEKLTREGKEVVETPGITNPSDPIEQRLAAIENAVLQLSHFIPE